MPLPTAMCIGDLRLPSPQIGGTNGRPFLSVTKQPWDKDCRYVVLIRTRVCYPPFHQLRRDWDRGEVRCLHCLGFLTMRRFQLSRNRRAADFRADLGLACFCCRSFTCLPSSLRRSLGAHRWSLARNALPARRPLVGRVQCETWNFEFEEPNTRSVSSRGGDLQQFVQFRPGASSAMSRSVLSWWFS